MENKNTVELIGIYGGDELHALSAWTSTSRDLDDEKRKRIPALLKVLAEGSDGHPHGTPFEKSAIHFLVTTDIASHIHIIKHRIGVPVNAESARYKELKEDKYYLPEDWTDICCSKGLKYSFIGNQEYIAQVGYKWIDLLQKYTDMGNVLYHQCVADLTPTLGRKRAKESARFFKTYNSQITADVMFNFRSFTHFQGLRNGAAAQLEIKNIAKEMLRLVKETGKFDESLKAFGLWDKA